MQHLLYDRIARYILPDSLAVFVEYQVALGIDDVQVRAVAVVMDAQQAMQCVAFTQEQRGADEASIAAVGAKDRMGYGDQVDAVRGGVRVGNQRARSVSARSHRRC